MMKHLFFAVLACVISTPLYSIEQPCDRYPFSCLPENRFTVSNTNYEEQDYDTTIILSISSNNIQINYMQVTSNTSYSRDDASFEIQDVDNTDYDDGDSYEMCVTYDVGEDDDQEDNYDDGESFDDGLFFDNAPTY
ncbi:hypothetical protein CBL_09667 [Carabus blaptoides fortunei]